MIQYIVTGMSCAACSARVEKAVSKVPGVTSCSVSLLTNSMGVEGTATEQEIIKAVKDAGYGASKKGEGAAKVQPAQAAFRQRYLDALAVAKAALALPWVDTGRVYTFGEGFGGGLALLAASLCPAVSRCAALNPLPGDFAGLGLPGYDELDAANFAPLCRAEVLLGTCLMDEYAPPKGQAAIYNRLTCPKQWKLYPKYVHERVNFFENQMLCFFKDGIPEA